MPGIRRYFGVPKASELSRCRHVAVAQALSSVPTPEVGQLALDLLVAHLGVRACGFQASVAGQALHGSQPHPTADKLRDEGMT